MPKPPIKLPPKRTVVKTTASVPVAKPALSPAVRGMPTGGVASALERCKVLQTGPRPFIQTCNLVGGLTKSGKTHFAASIPDALHIDTEEKSVYVRNDFVRSKAIVCPKSWTDFQAIMKEAIAKKFPHIVIDQLDEIINLAEGHYSTKVWKKPISQAGDYGAGYTEIALAFLNEVMAAKVAGIGVTVMLQLDWAQTTHGGNPILFLKPTVYRSTLSMLKPLFEGIFRIDVESTKVWRGKPPKQEVVYAHLLRTKKPKLSDAKVGRVVRYDFELGSNNQLPETIVLPQYDGFAKVAALWENPYTEETGVETVDEITDEQEPQSA